jgi:hypothetical protein
MKLIIVDLYGDGESLRVCEDKPGVDQIISEFKEDDDSEEHFDEFMERKGVHVFLTRTISLEPEGLWRKVHSQQKGTICRIGATTSSQYMGRRKT